MHRSNHPTESTFSYFKMYDLKACNHSEDFANWIIEKLSQRAKRGQVTYFPAFNAKHINDIEQRELLPNNTTMKDLELGKRQELLNIEVELF